MTRKRIIVELGAGTALHGGNYTKAAVRAVQDAIHHSSMSFLKSLRIPAAEMEVEVTIGVQRPDMVDAEAVRTALPHGRIIVKVVKGGLDVPDPEAADLCVIASAAVAVFVDMAKRGTA
ncbi:MAG TPA: Lin0512 family protein [Hyphomicrobiaceae bacterium]|nr:Lin0512 family protein [Hyphomicrobiaceae bacterium]